jgi:hypothetical protein
MKVLKVNKSLKKGASEEEWKKRAYEKKNNFRFSDDQMYVKVCIESLSKACVTRITLSISDVKLRSWRLCFLAKWKIIKQTQTFFLSFHLKLKTG